MTITPELLVSQMSAISSELETMNDRDIMNSPVFSDVINALLACPQIWNHIQLCTSQPIGAFACGMVMGLKIAEAAHMEETIR